MDLINDLLPEHLQAIVLQVLVILSAAMPLLEKIAAATATKLDDQALAWLKKLLGLVPRVRFGKEVTR